MEFVLGDRVLDVDRHELRRGGELIALEPQVFDLLVYLVRNRQRMVSKDDLLQAVWGGRIISGSTLTSRINAVRKAIGDDGRTQRLIRTVSRKGLRFVGTVREEYASTDPSRPALTLPDKPSIAVLPFANLTGDPEQEYFADGMVEEIITALSRIRWLFVIARNSTVAYKGQGVDVNGVGRELGVRYVLEGSVRKAGRRARITAQLIDALSGAHLWADRFDGSLDDVFELQDKVASSVAGVIEPALQAAETARSGHRPTADLTAYDLYLRGYAIFLSAARQVPQALSLMEQAIARDPGYGPALAWAAYCCFALIHGNRSDDREAHRRKGVDFARRAFEVAAEDPNVLVNAAAPLAYFGEDIEAMIRLVARALTLNPSFAHGWYVSGMIKMWAGRPDDAINDIETARYLNPRARMGSAVGVIGYSHFFARRFDKAVPNLLLTIQEDESYAQPYRALAACYAHMGRLDEARLTAARLRVITPVVMPDMSYLRRSEDRELLVSGLRLAIGE